MTEIVKVKKVFRIPYARRHRRSIKKSNRRHSEPQHIAEILPDVMANIKKRMKQSSSLVQK
jgi:hypothetical protein